jgi:hypothetical protein
MPKCPKPVFDVLVFGHIGFLTYWFLDILVFGHIGFWTYWFSDILVFGHIGFRTYWFSDCFRINVFCKWGISVTLWPRIKWQFCPQLNLSEKNYNKDKASERFHLSIFRRMARFPTFCRKFPTFAKNVPNC